MLALSVAGLSARASQSALGCDLFAMPSIGYGPDRNGTKGYLAIRQLISSTESKFTHNALVHDGKLLAVKRPIDGTPEAKQPNATRFRMLECFNSPFYEGGLRGQGLLQTEEGHLCLTLKNGTVSMENCAVTEGDKFASQWVQIDSMLNPHGPQPFPDVGHRDKEDGPEMREAVLQHDAVVSLKNNTGNYPYYLLALIDSAANPGL